uniref:Uncharacterized protein n=1 Tax=Zea mays TaxID=4577 RepID=C0PCN0_MAIZE|nr:unknown [Zea mays]|eukprot:NP_001288387.1 uncharacterized protein LOC103652876 [Zea mays]
MSLFGHPSKRKVQTLAHLHPNHLKNPLVQHQLHNEGADEADHASLEFQISAVWVNPKKGSLSFGCTLGASTWRLECWHLATRVGVRRLAG